MAATILYADFNNAVADGVAVFSTAERGWAVQIDWAEVRSRVGQPTASVIS